MTDQADLPWVLSKAVQCATLLSPPAGYFTKKLYEQLWGDVGRIKNAADAWQHAAKNARATNDALGAHVEQILGSEKWTGDAAEAYKSWVGELQTKFLAPVCQGMDKTRDELMSIAETVENMRRALITSAIQFTVAYFALQKMGPLGTAVGAIFSTAGIELLNDHTSGLLGIWDDYFRALEPHAIALRKIPDLPDAKVGVHIRYPDGRGGQAATPPINREKIGDWGNWGNVKVD